MMEYHKIIFKNKTVQRRLIHISGGFFIAYYLLPKTILFSFNKQWILFLILLLVLGIELYRRNTNHEHRLDSYFRDYEHKRPASYSYFTIGSVVLLVFFPQHISIPCILSTALCDPIIGEMKQRNKNQIGYLIGFLISFLFFSFAWSSASIQIMILAAFLGASSLIFAEHISNYWMDDDFLMQLVPAIILTFFISILSIFSIQIHIVSQLISPL